MAKAQNIDLQSISGNNKWALTYSIARKNQIPPFADEVFSSTQDLDSYLSSSPVVYDGQLFRVVDSSTNDVTFYYAKWDSSHDCYVKEELVPANQGGGSNYVFDYTTEAQQKVIDDIKVRAIPPKMFYFADLAISQSSNDDIGIENTLGIRDTNQGSHGGIIKSNGYYYINASGVDPSMLGTDPRLHLQVADFVDNTVIEIAHFSQVNNGVKLYIGNATNNFIDIFGADNSKTDAYLHVGYQGNLPRISQVGDRYVIIFTHGFYLAASSARGAGLDDACVNGLPAGPTGYNLLRRDSNNEIEIL